MHQASGVPEDGPGDRAAWQCELMRPAPSCGLRHELEQLWPVFIDRGDISVCVACGELVNMCTHLVRASRCPRLMVRAEEETRRCDLFLVLGSSLVVTPAAHFPAKAKQNGARLVILNRDETPLDDVANLSPCSTPKSG